jgi:hypothetical protein
VIDGERPVDPPDRVRMLKIRSRIRIHRGQKIFDDHSCDIPVGGTVTDLDADSDQGMTSDGRPPVKPSSGMAEALPALQELTSLLLAADTVDGVLRRVVIAAQDVIPGTDLVSITLRRQDGTSKTPVGTGEVAVELDQAQYRTGVGPCVDSADPEGPAYALSNDLENEAAWPAFAANATAQGYKSVLSTALLPDSGAAPFTGALNVYSTRTDAFDDGARDLAFLLATYASLALALAHARQDLIDAQDFGANLREAVQTRTVIGQATGILMARRKLTAGQAFDVLKRTSQNRNIKLARLALLLSEEPGLADRL